ncbi:MAG: LCP family protein [Monoglobales bacterium]
MTKFKRNILSAILIVCLIAGVYTVGTFIISGSLGGIFGSTEKVILVMGTDNAGLRTDVLMVGFINGENKTVDVISIPRDTQVKIGKKIYKINSAYAIGQEEQTIETVEKLLDVRIDGYVKFSFDTFRETIDALGGVEFDVPQDMFYEDPYQDLYIDLKAGPQHLNGEQAEGLVRYRRYPTGDEGRIAVQQSFIKEIIKQKANPLILVRAPAIISSLNQHIDTSLNTNEIIELAGLAVRAGSDGFNTYKLPGGAKYQYGASYYICDKAATKQLVEQIRQ